MNRNEVCEEILKMVSKVIDERKKSAPVIKRIVDDISEKLDSVEFVMLIVDIENKFGVSVSDDDFEIERVNTVDKLADLVCNYKENK